MNALLVNETDIILKPVKPLTKEVAEEKNKWIRNEWTTKQPTKP